MKLERRAALRGLGTLLALPALERFAPARAHASRGPATTASGAPLRMAFLMFPNGVNWAHWRPLGEGKGAPLGKAFAPLGPLAREVQVFTGLAHDEAAAKGDGPGDHARANATFLTGVHARKTAGADLQIGISVDQVAAQRVGHLTRLPSLELGTDRSRKSGNCDNGYNCAYQYNLSWASPTVPMPPESDPRAVFERLFGAGPPAQRQRAHLERQRARKSVVDFVREEARRLEGELGANDRQKLDEYLGGVRAIERQIEQAERFQLPRARRPAPEAIPPTHGAHARLMLDLLALAFETDSTRIATFPLAHEGSNRSFGEIGIAEGHHHLSHHQRDAEKLAKVARIDLHYMELFAHLVRRLARARDVDGRRVLDNTMVVYGCAIGDGDRHNHDDLPVAVAGGGGGRLRPGRHVKLRDKAPMTNLFLTMLDAMGAPTEKLGDSTGPLEDV